MILRFDEKIFVFLFLCFIILINIIAKEDLNMVYPVVESAVDVAYWLFDKASDTRSDLDDYKMQQMLFLAQLLFAKTYNQEMLFPSLFICDENGFFEPNIQKILAQGRPFMPRARFNTKVSEFLDEIWGKYAVMSSREIKSFILNSSVYAELVTPGKKRLVDFRDLANLVHRLGSIAAEQKDVEKRKVLLSQNGPVMVSKWSPRKVSKGDM